MYHVRNDGSAIAARSAATATTLRLNSGMQRRIGARISGDAIITPTRMPARPNAFEKVRPISTFGIVGGFRQEVLAEEIVIRLVDEHQRVAGFPRDACGSHPSRSAGRSGCSGC